jgi:hypothetical protein
MNDGTIYVNSGLLARLTNPDQLAFVLAHEAAHWTQQHGLARYRTTNNTLLLAQIADTLVTPIASRFKLKTVAERGIDMASVASFNLYSQELELEADEIGVQAMIKAGYDPLNAVSVLRMFTTGDGGATDGSIIGNHPDTELRIAAIRDHVAKGAELTPGHSPQTDKLFIRKTAQVRLANARWAYRAGYFIEALNNLKILEHAFSDNSRSRILSRIKLERGVVYLAMARDLDFIKSSIPSNEWERLYHAAQNEDVALQWCREGFKYLGEITYPASLVQQALKIRATFKCGRAGEVNER